MIDLHEQWPHRWLNKKVESRNSPAHGLGIFAVEKINKGEPVLVFGGVVVPVSELIEYKKHMGQVGVQINDDFFLVPISREELERAGTINHSCNPNLGFLHSTVMQAIRDIEPGEECVTDYSFAYTLLDPFDCNCGSADCRKRITGDDWKNPDLQYRYKEHFLEFIRNKIDTA